MRPQLDSPNVTIAYPLQVHAHGGGIYQHNERFYWYGTTQKYAPAWISKGINLYSSKDLQHWHFEGQIFNDSQIKGVGFHHPYRIERPKVTSLHELHHAFAGGAVHNKLVVGSDTSNLITVFCKIGVYQDFPLRVFCLSLGYNVLTVRCLKYLQAVSFYNAVLQLPDTTINTSFVMFLELPDDFSACKSIISASADPVLRK